MKKLHLIVLLSFLVAGFTACSASGQPLIWTSSKGSKSVKRTTNRASSTTSGAVRASVGGAARASQDKDEDSSISTTSSPSSLTGAVRPGSN